jgi:hypothetical protein
MMIWQGRERDEFFIGLLTFTNAIFCYPAQGNLSIQMVDASY